MRYCRYGLEFIPRLMPVEPAGFVDKQVARVLRYTSLSDDPHTHYRKTEKNRVLHVHYVQLVVHSWPRSNVWSIIQFARTSLWCFSRTTDVTVDFHLFTSNSKIRCWPTITYYIYGLEALTKTSGNVRATVETQQLTVDRAALYGVWINSHPCISEVPPDFDII